MDTPGCASATTSAPSGRRTTVRPSNGWRPFWWPLASTARGWWRTKARSEPSAGGASHEAPLSDDLIRNRDTHRVLARPPAPRLLPPFRLTKETKQMNATNADTLLAELIAAHGGDVLIALAAAAFRADCANNPPEDGGW